MLASTKALIILIIAMVLFVSEVIPIPVTAVCAAVSMGVFGVIPFASALSGFSNDVTIMVIGAMIVGEALFETGVANKIGEAVIKRVGFNEKAFVLACIILSVVLSAFLSNTAVVAMMLPVITATAIKSNGKIRKKSASMAVAFAANIGGGMTLVGSTPNLICQGVLNEMGAPAMSFFDLTIGSLPRLAFLLLYYATFGYTLQNKVFDFSNSNGDDNGKESEQKKEYNTRKMIISSILLVLMVIGFVTGVWTVGAVALITGLLCIITKCISLKDTFSRLDWNTVWVLAGSFGIASGIDKSGAGKIIADTVLDFFGGTISHFSLLLIFTLLAVLMANIMSSSASAAILSPIALSLCTSLGYSPIPIMMVIVWSLNLAFLTPIATPPVTMTMQCGYRFLDYTKLGAPLVIGCLIATVAIYPFLV